MKEIKQPVITEDDVLAGQITFPVSKRKGGSVEVTVKALPWRAALEANAKAARGDVGFSSIEILPVCLDKKQGSDEFLNEIVPAHLFWMASAAMQLSNGVDETKKLAAMKSEPVSETSSSPSAS